MWDLSKLPPEPKRKHAVIVQTVYGFKVILCTSHARAIIVMGNESGRPETFWAATCHQVTRNRKRLRVKNRCAQYDRLAMIRANSKGHEVVLYDDGYKLQSDLTRWPKYFGALVFSDCA